MKERGRQYTFVQCQCCGKISRIPRKVSIETSIISSICDDCGYNKALNLGNKEEDIYIYINPNVDSRYYNY